MEAQGIITLMNKEAKTLVIKTGSGAHSTSINCHYSSAQEQELLVSFIDDRDIRVVGEWVSRMKMLFIEEYELVIW